MTIRAFFRAAQVENAQSPYDTIHLKVFYPAQMLEKIDVNQDIAPADATHYEQRSLVECFCQAFLFLVGFMSWFSHHWRKS